VIRFDHLSGAQKRAYLIADNQLALQAGWDDALLAEELAWPRDERFNLDQVGCDATELERLLAFADGEPVSPLPLRRRWPPAGVEPQGLPGSHGPSTDAVAHGRQRKVNQTAAVRARAHENGCCSRPRSSNHPRLTDMTGKDQLPPGVGPSTARRPCLLRRLRP
jgi:hypothetical protein